STHNSNLSLHDALPISEPVLRGRPFLPGGHLREDGDVARGAAALARLPAAGAAGRMGRAGKGILGVGTRVVSLAPEVFHGQHNRSEEHTSELQSRGHLV